MGCKNGSRKAQSSKLPFRWDDWQSLDRAIDAPARQDVLVRGWGSRDCTDWLFGFSTKSDTVLLRLVSALLKDVDYLPMAKPVSSYPLGDTPRLCASLRCCRLLVVLTEGRDLGPMDRESLV